MQRLSKSIYAEDYHLFSNDLFLPELTASIRLSLQAVEDLLPGNQATESARSRTSEINQSLRSRVDIRRKGNNFRDEGSLTAQEVGIKDDGI